MCFLVRSEATCILRTKWSYSALKASHCSEIASSLLPLYFRTSFLTSGCNRLMFSRLATWFLLRLIRPGLFFLRSSVFPTTLLANASSYSFDIVLSLLILADSFDAAFKVRFLSTNGSFPWPLSLVLPVPFILLNNYNLFQNSDLSCMMLTRKCGSKNQLLSVNETSVSIVAVWQASEVYGSESPNHSSLSQTSIIIS